MNLQEQCQQELITLEAQLSTLGQTFQVTQGPLLELQLLQVI